MPRAQSVCVRRGFSLVVTRLDLCSINGCVADRETSRSGAFCERIHETDGKVNLHGTLPFRLVVFYETDSSSQKHPAKLQMVKFKMTPDAFARFFGTGGDFVDGEIVPIRPDWRLLEELDDVFAYGDAWRKHIGKRHRFILTRMRVDHTAAGYATFKFAGGLRVYGRNREGDREFPVLLLSGYVMFCDNASCFVTKRR